MKNAFTAFSSTFLVLLCALSPAVAEAAKNPPPILDEKALDRAVDPCHNFYQFACGGWAKATPIPADKSGVYRQSSDIDDINDELLKGILEKFSSDVSASEEARKLGKLYQSCVAVQPTESLQSLRGLLGKIPTLNESRIIARASAASHLSGAGVLFSFGAAVDPNDSTKMAATLDQGGLGLPDRSYYFPDPTQPDDHTWAETLRLYEAHIARSFQLLGVSAGSARREARAVLEIESALARMALTPEERRDPVKLNNPMTLSEVKALAPDFHWDEFFGGLRAPLAGKIIVMEPEFFKNLSVVLRTFKAEALRSYFRWHWIRSLSVIAGGDLEKESFAFYEQRLQGKKTKEERWKTCVGLSGRSMTDVLSKAYVEAVQGQRTRDAFNLMVDQIRVTFSEELDALAWLDAATRDAAKEKLAKLVGKVGYPDRWKSYESLKISSDSAVENALAVQHFASAENLHKIGQAVNPYEWEMAPWIFNAYYEPTRNEFVFPLAILLPPVMDFNASDGANWGSAGGTLGHELSHGFDDEGHLYDASGNLRDWWTPSVSEEFTRKAQCYIDQGSTYEALPGLFVNGKLTLGENLADQGGTKIAYLAYRAVAARRNSTAPLFAGYNEEQQFFLSYAQSWCGKSTEEALRKQVMTDPHPPEEFRVNMVLKNMQPFREAFGCQTGSAMAPAKTCELW